MFNITAIRHLSEAAFQQVVWQTQHLTLPWNQDEPEQDVPNTDDEPSNDDSDWRIVREIINVADNIDALEAYPNGND